MRHVRQFLSMAELEHFLNVDGKHMEVLHFSACSHGDEVLYTVICFDWSV